ncbi:MAG: hypothetical protein AAF533_24455 [Acidobacteriota bacterium]
MLLKFGTNCRGGEHELGTLWGVTVEPKERLFLRAVVEQPQADPLVRAKVPFGRVDRANDEQVVLSCSPEELGTMPRHDEPAADAQRKRSRRRRRGEEIDERVLTKTTKVVCRDGEVGQLMSITVDARSGDLEDLSFEGGVTTPREVVVPASMATEWSEETVQLDCSRDDLESFTGR